MPVITRELLRKRAEHNEGMITTLEEISLHQEELESINAVLGTYLLSAALTTLPALPYPT
jgi:protein TilB